MNKEAKIVYGMVAVSILLVATFLVLWKLSTRGMVKGAGKSNTQIDRYVERDIELTDAGGEKRHFTDLNGKVWLVSHVFTRCPGQCAGISVALRDIADDLGDEGPLHLVSVSLDPAHDKPEHLKAFAETHALVRDDWWFVTGEPEPLNKYMKEVFLLAAKEIPEAERSSEFDLFEHQAMVVMVDHNLKMRGWYYPFDASSAAALRRDLKDVLGEAKKAARGS